MTAGTHRILGAFGTALAGAALLAGGALAADRPDDRGGMIGVGGAQVVVPTGVFERAVERHVVAAVPDVFERAVLRAQQSNAVRPDDRADPRGPGIVTTAAPTAVAAPRGDGFAWGDAFFGAAAMLGIVLLGAVGTLTLRHRGRVALR